MDNLAIHFLNYDEQLVTQEAVNKLITIFVTIRFQMRGWLWMNRFSIIPGLMTRPNW